MGNSVSFTDENNKIDKLLSDLSLDEQRYIIKISSVKPRTASLVPDELRAARVIMEYDGTQKMLKELVLKEVQKNAELEALNSRESVFSVLSCYASFYDDFLLNVMDTIIIQSVGSVVFVLVNMSRKKDVVVPTEVNVLVQRKYGSYHWEFSEDNGRSLFMELSKLKEQAFEAKTHMHALVGRHVVNIVSYSFISLSFLSVTYKLFWSTTYYSASQKQCPKP